MADDDDDTIELGKREADSLMEAYLTAQDLESAILNLLEQDNPLIQPDDDDDNIKLGNREADSLSEAYLTAHNLESAVIDLLEQDNPLTPPLTPEVSRSQEDEDLDGALSTPETVASDSLEVTPRASKESTCLERDMAMAEGTVSSTPSIEKIFQNSLISNPEFAIEKVLGEATANILTEAETEASKIADKLQALDAEWQSETDLTEPHSILTCRVCQLFVRTVDRLLDKSEELKDHYLPLTEEEIGSLKNAVEEMEDAAPDHQMEACLARINNLSSKLRQRAYMMALSKLRLARRSTQENIFQLHQTIDLIGQVQQEDHPQSHHSYRKLSAITVGWTKRHSVVAGMGSVHEGSLHVERDEMGTPLAQSSFIDEPEIPSIEKVRIPIVEISHVEDEEVDSYAETPEEQESMTPPPEISLEEVTPMPPLEIVTEVTPMPPLEISSTEKSLPSLIQRVPLAKVATPLDERIKRDMANITVTAPGCDEEPMPPLKTQTFGEDDIPPSEMEAQALQMSRSLACNLQDTYENLLTHLQDLPAHLQQKLYQTCQRMAKLRSDFDSAHSFEDLSRDVLSKSFEIMVEAQGSLDELMEYALQSPKALLWLKDHLPVSEEGEPERVIGTEGPFPFEGEAVPPGIKMMAKKRNILIIQQTYDPKGCEDDTLPGKEKAVTSPPQKRDSEDILKTLQAYEPKGCDDEIPSNKEKAEVSPSSKEEWNILKTLQGYVPKLSENKGFSSEDKKETPPSTKDEEEMREPDILKLQQAHDPKGCDDGAEIVAPPAGEQELQDILQVQQAYDPKDCYEGAPPEEEKVARPSGKWEREGILQIQQAYDPKGCDDEPPPRREEATPSSKPAEWNLLKMFQAYVPKGSTDEAPSGKEKKEAAVPPPEEQVVRKKSILKHHQPYNGQSSNEKGVLVEKEKVQPSSTQEFGSILKIQEMHDPKGCDEESPSRKEKEEVVHSPGKVEDILKIQQAYDPRGCDDETPSRMEKKEVPPSGKQEEWNIMKFFQSYIPKSRSDEASAVAVKVATSPPSKQEVKEVVPPARQQEAKDWDILKIQKAYDPQGCKDEDN